VNSSGPAGGARITSAILSQSMLTVTLDDDRVLSVPLWWYPRLLGATRIQRRRWRVTREGEGIQWPDLDVQISAEGLLSGIRPRDARQPPG